MAALSTDEVLQSCRGASIARAVDNLPSGLVRIETDLMYPDGSCVDVFLDEQSCLLPEDRLLLTDAGQTTAWLLNIPMKPWLSAKRKGFLEDVLRVLEVHQDGGQLEYRVASVETLGCGVLRLAQACVRVADLMFTKRAGLEVAFTDEVEEVIAATDLPYEPGVELPGKYDKRVRLDFLVHGPRKSSGVLALSSANRSTAHTSANEYFRRWHDLASPTDIQRLTVWDDRYNVYRDDDLSALSEASVVIPLSDRSLFLSAIAA